MDWQPNKAISEVRMADLTLYLVVCGMLRVWLRSVLSESKCNFPGLSLTTYTTRRQTLFQKNELWEYSWQFNGDTRRIITVLIMIIVVVLVELWRNRNALKIFEDMVWFKDTSTTHRRWRGKVKYSYFIWNNAMMMKMIMMVVLGRIMEEWKCTVTAGAELPLLCRDASYNPT